MRYNDVIRMADKDAAATHVSFDGLSTEEIRGRIDTISQTLIGPGVDAYERLMLNHERRACRDELARREARA